MKADLLRRPLCVIGAKSTSDPRTGPLARENCPASKWLCGELRSLPSSGDNLKVALSQSLRP